MTSQLDPPTSRLGAVDRVSSVPKAPNAKASLETSSLPGGHGEWILVVDDEAMMCMIARLTLEGFGYRVLVAADGVEAVDLYSHQEGNIAAVISDLLMPRMDGPALIEALSRMNPQVRIIASSGFLDSLATVQDASSCVKGLLPKPYSTESLLRLLARVLGSEPPPENTDA